VINFPLSSFTIRISLVQRYYIEYSPGLVPFSDDLRTHLNFKAPKHTFRTPHPLVPTVYGGHDRARDAVTLLERIWPRVAASRALDRIPQPAHGLLVAAEVLGLCALCIELLEPCLPVRPCSLAVRTEPETRPTDPQTVRRDPAVGELRQKSSFRVLRVRPEVRDVPSFGLVDCRLVDGAQPFARERQTDRGRQVTTQLEDVENQFIRESENRA
jgi:hypothetical protein